MLQIKKEAHVIVCEEKVSFCTLNSVEKVPTKKYTGIVNMVFHTTDTVSRFRVYRKSSPVFLCPVLLLYPAFSK